MSIYDEVQTAVSTLAQNNGPTGVADFLRSQDIVGKKATVGSCPVARWIERETGHKVEVSNSFLVFSLPSSDYHGSYNNRSIFYSGRSIPMFVRNFDQGFYPDLEEK